MKRNPKMRNLFEKLHRLEKENESLVKHGFYRRTNPGELWGEWSWLSNLESIEEKVNAEWVEKNWKTLPSEEEWLAVVEAAEKTGESPMNLLLREKLFVDSSVIWTLQDWWESRKLEKLQRKYGIDRLAARKILEKAFESNKETGGQLTHGIENLAQLEEEGGREALESLLRAYLRHHATDYDFDRPRGGTTLAKHKSEYTADQEEFISVAVKTYMG